MMPCGNFRIEAALGIEVRQRFGEVGRDPVVDQFRPAVDLVGVRRIAALHAAA